MDTKETATVEVTQASKAAIARGAPIIIAKDDYAMAERVIENWCVKGDKRKTRQLIAEGIALARDEARIAAALLRDANSHYSAGQIEEIERCHRTRATRQDGLREATIEECAELAENWNPGRRDRVTETGIANAIRALSDSRTREESGSDEALKEQEFNRGVLIAVSTLINCWGRGTETEHLLAMINATPEMVEQMGFDNYDREPLLAALSASPEGEG